AEDARCLGLADLPLAGLDELEYAAPVAAGPRAHQHPEGRGALALAVAGDNDQQRPVAWLAALGVGASDVLAHAAAPSGWSSPCAASANSPARPTRTGPSSVSITLTASAARPGEAAAHRPAPSGSDTRPSVSTMAIARRRESRQRSRRTSSS